MSRPEDTSNVTGHISSHVTRRRFLQSAGAGAALAVGRPLFASAQDATPSASPIAGPLVATNLPTSWDREADVVVVGSGAAAFAAAVTARQAGADVVMLERGANPGGTTLISGSEYWIPNNSKMRAAGKTDPRDDALKYMARLSYPQLYDPESPTLGMFQRNYDLIATYYDTASVAIDDFEKWGALFSCVQPSFGFSGEPKFADPDYHAD